MDKLNIDEERKLTKHEVKLILEILRFELNEYQRNDLEVLIERSHCFNIKSLKAWVSKNRKFILHYNTNIKDATNKTAFVTGELSSQKNKTVDLTNNKAMNSVTLPKISMISKRASSYKRDTSPGKLGKTVIGKYVEFVKKNKGIRESFQKKLEQTLEKQKKVSGEEGKEYSKKVRERLRKSIKKQQNEYVKNVELLALMQKYCCQMQRFRSIMLNGTTNKSIFKNSS